MDTIFADWEVIPLSENYIKQLHSKGRGAWYSKNKKRGLTSLFNVDEVTILEPNDKEILSQEILPDNICNN